MIDLFIFLAIAFCGYALFGIHEVLCTIAMLLESQQIRRQKDVER